MMKEKLRHVALVGCPNVGKSTLFNALLNRRVAITHEVRGVTHEGATSEFEYNGKRFLLKDTGGITDYGTFAALIRERSMSAVEAAGVVVFVVSVEGLSAEDEEIAAVLRKRNAPVILVVNKVDNEKRSWEAQNMHRLGFGEAVCVSALHKRNLSELLDRISDLHAHMEVNTGEGLEAQGGEEARAVDAERVDATRLLILGKPNTGKSSLVNRITGSQCMVSEIAGTTRDIAQEDFVHEGRNYTLIDSAGIRRKNRIENDVEYYSIHRAIETIGRSDVVVLLVDVTEGFSEQDKKLVSLVVRRGRALIVALNKWDIIAVTKNRLQAEKDRLSFLFPHIHYAPVLPVSARTGFGTDEIMRTAKRLHEQLCMRIETPRLNRHVQQWVEEKTPPLIKGKRGKIKYISQVDSTPPTFKVRVNNKKLFPEFYQLYIKNKLRKTYSFTEVPFHVLFIDSV